MDPEVELASTTLADPERPRLTLGEMQLLRHLAVVLLARMFGFAPVWRTGFRPDPFIAHAWVEVDATPVGEPAAVAQFHTVLEVVPQYHSAAPSAATTAASKEKPS